MSPADDPAAWPAFERLQEQPVEAARQSPGQAPRQADGLFLFHDACVLGTRLNLAVQADVQSQAYAAACAVRAEIDRLDGVFNWRRDDSEIPHLNRADRFTASPDLFSVMEFAERWRVISGGALSARLGALGERWRMPEPPSHAQMASLAKAIASEEVGLDPVRRLIARPDRVLFDLDAIAKGYIVDRALEAAMGVAGVSGAMVDIGGDIACAGPGPSAGAWRIDAPDPLRVFDNAPLAFSFYLHEAAVATSGCGPRDVDAEGRVRSVTLDPRTGWPLAHRRSVTAIAPSAMEADALATAVLVMEPGEAQAMLARLPGRSARIAAPDTRVWLGSPALRAIEYEPSPQAGGGTDPLWKQGWYADITFSAPPKDMRRDIAFRSPYVAIWISDTADRPVRTLLLIGRYKEWHESNHIWWRLNRGKVDNLFSGRSMSTRGSGIYKVYWDGGDDQGRLVAPGTYRLHVETSREGGGHEHRVVELDVSRPRAFEAELPVTARSGGLFVSFRKF